MNTTLIIQMTRTEIIKSCTKDEKFGGLVWQEKVANPYAFSFQYFSGKSQSYIFSKVPSYKMA